MPFLEVAKSIINGLHQSTDNQTVSFRATVHEDNQGALTLANLEPGRDTPRSKFYALKLHWFRLWLKPNKIKLAFCPTKQQKADFLNKHQPVAVYEANRKLAMGW